jgi:hypothetical protein
MYGIFALFTKFVPPTDDCVQGNCITKTDRIEAFFELLSKREVQADVSFKVEA